MSRSNQSALREPDSRTLQWIKSFLAERDIKLGVQVLNKLSSNVILRKTYLEDVAELQQELSARRSDETHVKTPDPLPQLEALQASLKQKDRLLLKRAEEYQSLKKTLNDTQNEMKQLDDMNSSYLQLINQYEARSPNKGMAGDLLEKMDDIEELRQKLEYAESQVEHFQGMLQRTNEKLMEKVGELDEVNQRENTIKEQLGLDYTADERKVEKRIKEMHSNGRMKQAEVRKIQRELRELKDHKSALEDKVTSLTRQKEKLEFDLRQKDISMRRIRRQSNTQYPLKTTRQPTVLTTVNIRFPPGEEGLPTVRDAAEQQDTQETNVINRYCLLCRSECHANISQPCRVHFQPIRHGKWTCCHDNCHRAAGCTLLSHLYLVVNAATIELSDGDNVIKIWQQ